MEAYVLDGDHAQNGVSTHSLRENIRVWSECHGDVSFVDCEYDDTFTKLVEALDADLDWLTAHTHWLARARDWEKQGRDRSLLLRGNDLGSAEPPELCRRILRRRPGKLNTPRTWSHGRLGCAHATACGCTPCFWV